MGEQEGGKTGVSAVCGVQMEVVASWSNVSEESKKRLMKKLQDMSEPGGIVWEAQHWNNTVAPRQE